jgi:hypothetical protein
MLVLQDPIGIPIFAAYIYPTSDSSHVSKYPLVRVHVASRVSDPTVL